MNADGRHIRKIGNPTLALRQEGMPEGLSIVRNSRFNPVPEHVHDYVEISYVYRGRAPQIVNGATIWGLAGVGSRRSHSISCM